MIQRTSVNYNACELGPELLEKATELADRAEAYEIPDDYEPDLDILSWNELLAEIRHNYTNYEELLHELPLCVDYWDAGGFCPWDGEADPECPLCQEAHDIIKWACKDKAEEAWILHASGEGGSHGT